MTGNTEVKVALVGREELLGFGKSVRDVIEILLGCLAF